MADAIIRGAGLERYYADREQPAPRPEPLAGGWNAVPLEVDPNTGQCVMRFSIDGLRCASCVWVTENVLGRTIGVSDAIVSYATGRATLRFDPGKVTLGALPRWGTSPASWARNQRRTAICCCAWAWRRSRP
jgi:Cu2+-exporting ATPase